MPTPSARQAARVSPGFFPNIRSASLRSTIEIAGGVNLLHRLRCMRNISVPAVGEISEATNLWDGVSRQSVYFLMLLRHANTSGRERLIMRRIDGLRHATATA